GRDPVRLVGVQGQRKTRLLRSSCEKLSIRETNELTGKWTLGDGSAELRADASRLSRGQCDAQHTRLGLEFDVGFIAEPTQPQLGLLVGLARANRFGGFVPADLVGVIDTAAAEHLHDVPAELGMEGLADLAVLQVCDRLLELRYVGAWDVP